MESAAKRPRPTCTDRVTLDVAGTLFHSTADTLRTNSDYFRQVLSGEWSERPGEPNFIDRDADTFKVLLSCMRNRTTLLPADDADLFGRVLLEAQYFGVDWLLHRVKAQVVQHVNVELLSGGYGPSIDYEQLNGTHDDLIRKLQSELSRIDENASAQAQAELFAKAAKAFDERFGGLEKALRNGILPARFFTKESAQPTIKHLIPAHPGDRVRFQARGVLDAEGDTFPPETPQDYEVVATYRAIAFAACVSAAGNEYVDAVISPREAVAAWNSEPLLLFEVVRGSEMLTGELRGNEEQLMLASVFCRRREDWISPIWMIEPHADNYADDN